MSFLKTIGDIVPVVTQVAPMIVAAVEPPMCRTCNPHGGSTSCGQSTTGIGLGCWCNKRPHSPDEGHSCGAGHKW